VQATAILLGCGLRSLGQAGRGSFEGEVVVVDLRGRVLAGSGSGYSALLCLGEVGQGKGDGTRVVWAFFFSFTYIGEGDLFSYFCYVYQAEPDISYPYNLCGVTKRQECSRIPTFEM
jgi:hypothetical protein